MDENLPEKNSEDILTDKSQAKTNFQDKISLPIKWRANEYEYIPKSSEWMWFVGSGAVAIIIWSIITRNFLFAVFSLVAVFALYAFNKKEPKEISFSIEINGIRAGEKFYSYKDIDSFSINFDPPRKKEIIIESKKLISNYLTIPLADINPNIARSVLMKYLTEKDHEPTLIETINDWL